MGIPKLKSFQSNNEKVNEKHLEKIEITKYQSLIKKSLNNEDKIKKAALIIELWINSKAKKP